MKSAEKRKKIEDLMAKKASHLQPQGVVHLDLLFGTADTGLAP